MRALRARFATWIEDELDATGVITFWFWSGN